MTDRYNIEELLANCVQPFSDRSDEDLDLFGRRIGKGGLADPISITEDGIMVDGRQRCLAMRARGRVWIDASDVHVIPDSNKSNALDWAIRMNADRRPLSVAEKAEYARTLQRTRKWSQKRIADAFGVSRPAVTQWLSAHPGDDGERPSFVVGEDGKTYDTERPRAERPPRHPWAPDGHAYRAIHKALRAIQENDTVAGLGPLQLAKLGQEISDLIEAAEGLQNQIGDES